MVEKKAYRLTDVGNAERFVDQFGESLRYAHDWREWMMWAEPVWCRDSNAIVRFMTRSVGEGIREDARTIQEDAEGLDGDDRKQAEALFRQYMAAANRAEGAAGIKNMLWVAEADIDISTTSGQFDAAVNLLNTPTATIDLQQDRAREHDPTDFLTQTTHARYVEGAECPQWLEVLNMVFGGNKSLIGYVQRAVGYSITAGISEQCVFYCYGTGENGKSIIFNTLRKMLGDYACEAMPGTFDARGSKRTIREDIARLRGKRLVTTVEVKKGEPLDSEMVKKMTGGEVMVAKNIYERPFEFETHFKVWFAANTQMPVPEATHGMWRRLHVVPFTRKIPKQKKVDYETLMARLAGEYPGILSWALEGHREWLRIGLKPPKEIIDATENYRADQDRIGEFMDMHCIIGEGKIVPAKDVYERFKQWCDDTGDYRIGKQRFYGEMKDRDFQKERRGANVPHLIGMDLKPSMYVVGGSNEWAEDDRLIQEQNRPETGSLPF